MAPLIQAPSQHLRLHEGRRSSDADLDSSTGELIGELCRTFERATGWPLQFISGAASDTGESPAGGTSALHPTLLDTDASPSDENIERADLATSQDLAAACSRLLNELLQTQTTLRRREAELAMGVPLVEHRQEQQHLAEQLESVLKGGAAERWLPGGRTLPARRGHLATPTASGLELALRAVHGWSAIVGHRHRRS